MSEKTFLVKMDDATNCRHSRFMYGIGKGCTAFYDGAFHECPGDLNNRPDWCPLVEHDISVCSEKYKEECEALHRQATERLGW